MDWLFLLAYWLVAFSLDPGDHNSMEERSKDLSKRILAG